MFVGYARVSTSDQTLAPQEDELRNAGCERIFSDIESGSKAKRPGLDELLAQVRRGDSVTVVRLDRLGRSLVDLVETVQRLKSAGVGFRSLREQIDTTTAGGKLIFHIFASLAEFERALILERTHAGLASARARGKFGGRPPKDDRQRARMAASLLADPTNTVVDVCRLLNVSRATAYRLAKKHAGQLPPQAVPESDKAVASVQRKSTETASQSKITSQPRKNRNSTSKSRKP